MMNPSPTHKQGDPLSSLLFNMVLQNSLEDGILRWQKKKGLGIYLSDNDHHCLTNLRFTDDVLLLASSKEQLPKMLCEFKKCSENVGLRIHPGKTKILSNQCSDTRKEIEDDNIKVEILTRGESARYSGQMITFQQQETTEIRNRIRAAWATFHKYGQELTSKNYLLKHRLRLFDAVTIPTICYADTHQRARENDTVDATQNAPTYHSNENKIQKDRETKRQDQRGKRHQRLEWHW